jgi:hypothetical protein
MKKNLLLFGFAAGIINIAGWYLIKSLFMSDTGTMDMEKGEIIGYAAMLLSFTMVFFGIKYHRDNGKNESFSFKKAFVAGLVIVLVASLIYVIGWELYYPGVKDSFEAMYEADFTAQVEEQDLSNEEVKAMKEEMSVWMENYENPLIRIPITFMEIFPVGLIVSLFSALILKRK